jgi:hypothetical protein
MLAHWFRMAALLTAGMATMACSPARPVEPLRPSYPVMLASAGYAGTARMAVRVERAGRATVVLRDTSTSGAPVLFGQSIRQAVKATRWRSARRWGRARTETLEYEVAFVLLRDTLPLGLNERYIPGNDTLPLVCPAVRTARRIVVCATAGRIRYSVISSWLPNDR